MLTVTVEILEGFQWASQKDSTLDLEGLSALIFFLVFFTGQ